MEKPPDYANAIRFIKSSTTTNEQRAKLAVLVSSEVCHDPLWRTWAEKWISGEDRSEDSAWASYLATGGGFQHLTSVVAYDVYWAAMRGDYVDSGVKTVLDAEKARKKEIEADAQKWAGESWKDVAEVWYSERGIDWRKLIESAKEE